MYVNDTDALPGMPIAVPDLRHMKQCGERIAASTACEASVVRAVSIVARLRLARLIHDLEFDGKEDSGRHVES